MSSLNDTTFQFAVFLLTGIPGQEDVQFWISIPFCCMYVISIIGNTVILFIIKTDPSLHEPMYILLSMLALTDLGLLIVTMPTTLGVYLVNSREISLNACFVQLYFIHTFSAISSSTLMLMAFDRFVAICDPLRYASILTPPRIAKAELVFVARSVCLMFPQPFLLKRFPYCHTNVLSQSYCLFQNVMKLVCADITVNSLYGLSVKSLSQFLDMFFIFLSYVMIFKTVVSVASFTESLKALNTCASHLCAVLLFYVPEICLSMLHRFGNSSSHLPQIILSYVYVLVPPLVNPIVYSVKSKHVRARILRIFFI
ncbi:olfactory receptor 51G2-like [Carettochelys insculpta]|uniref:olfactory receptor 51G2-like n=1 Tax=Carettochelys insculpta TaxID=44489 RepID=UPI003EB8C5EC